MNKKLVFLIIAVVSLVLVILVLKPTVTGNVTKAVQEQGTIDITFCPHQNCSTVLIDTLVSANQSIYCAFFDMNLKSVADLLSAKAKQIPVKIVFDGENKEHVAKLTPGFEHKFDTKSSYSHNKFCIIDGRLVVTGSMNPTLRDSSMNNNNLVIIQSSYLSDNFKDEFDELWNGMFGSGTRVKYPYVTLSDIPIENYFCPEDKCEQHVVLELAKAQHTVYFMTFSFTSQEVADSILANNKLVDIKGVFEKSQAANKYSQFERLKGFGLDVRTDSNKYNLHHKVFIIDNETVITGSYNPSTNADERNDENILIIRDKDIAHQYLKEFNTLFYN